MLKVVGTMFFNNRKLLIDIQGKDLPIKWWEER